MSSLDRIARESSKAHMNICTHRAGRQAGRQGLSGESLTTTTTTTTDIGNQLCPPLSPHFHRGLQCGVTGPITDLYLIQSPLVIFTKVF